MSAVQVTEWKRLLAISEAEVALQEAAKKEEGVNAMPVAERVAQQQAARLAERLALYGIVPGGSHNEGLLKALEAGKLRRLPRKEGRWEKAFMGTLVTFLVSLVVSTALVVAGIVFGPTVIKAPEAIGLAIAQIPSKALTQPVFLAVIVGLAVALIARTLGGSVITETATGVVAGAAAMAVAGIEITTPDLTEVAWFARAILGVVGQIVDFASIHPHILVGILGLAAIGGGLFATLLYLYKVDDRK